MHLGDFDTSAVIYGKFTTFRPSTGATFTLGGTPALSVYKDNSTTQRAEASALTADFDSVTGLNHYTIDTSADGTFYSAGSFFDIVITTGTVDGVSVTGSVVGRFTLRKNSALKPTTAGRTLDVSTGGEAGLDWANIGSPTTAVNLSATNIDVDQVVASVTGAVGSVTARVTANTDQLAGQTVTAAAGVTFPTSIASPTNITAGTITTVTNLTNLPTIPANWLTAAGMDATASAEIADAVWDEAISGHLGAGSTGAALNAAGSAGDPWTTPLPGAYGAGTAGYIIGTNIDTTVGSRSTLDAAGVRTAVGLASANLDTQLGDLPTAVENADALLGRNVAGGSSTGRLVKEALYALRNRWGVSAGTYTVYATDDSTPAWTSSVTGTAGADPLTASDPA